MSSHGGRSASGPEPPRDETAVRATGGACGQAGGPSRADGCRRGSSLARTVRSWPRVALSALTFSSRVAYRAQARRPGSHRASVCSCGLRGSMRPPAAMVSAHCIRGRLPGRAAWGWYDDRSSPNRPRLTLRAAVSCGTRSPEVRVGGGYSSRHATSCARNYPRFRQALETLETGGPERPPSIMGMAMRSPAPAGRASLSMAIRAA